jgi:hypothetical protein
VSRFSDISDKGCQQCQTNKPVLTVNLGEHGGERPVNRADPRQFVPNGDLELCRTENFRKADGFSDESACACEIQIYFLPFPTCRKARLPRQRALTPPSQADLSDSRFHRP